MPTQSPRTAPDGLRSRGPSAGTAGQPRLGRLVILIAACLGGCVAPTPHTSPVIVTPPPPPSPPAPPPAPETELRLELSEEEKAALSAQAAKDQEETERLMAGIDRERLTAEQLEKLQTVESLLTAAKAAEEKGDIPGRANLARKARLLAQELVPG